MRSLLTFAMGGLLLGCAMGSGALKGEEELLRTDREFAAATAAQGVEGWVAFFAPDGSMLRPQGPITGHAAVRAAMAPAFANPDFSLTWEPQRAELTPGGRLGYTTGRYRMRRKDASGRKLEVTGTYMNFWQKQPDGSWKVVADVGDPDGARPEPPKPAGN